MAVRLPTLSPVAWLTADRVTQQVLWLILFAILAPILGPRPYGLFSIVMVFVSALVIYGIVILVIAGVKEHGQSEI